MNLHYFHEAPFPVLFTQKDGSILFSNVKSHVLLKTTHEHLKEHGFITFIHEDCLEKYQEALLDPELNPTSELILCTTTNIEIPVQITINIVEDGLLWYIENKQQQMHFEMEQKRLQTLPKEYGHDINNLLTVILSATQLIEMELEEEDEDMRADLKDISDAAYRAAAQTRLFMNMGRQAYIKHEHFELNSIIKGKREFFLSLLNGSYSLNDTCWMYGSKTDIQTAISLGILHFKNRIADSSLVLETHVIEASPPFSTHTLGLNSGPYICCTIRDQPFDITSKMRCNDLFHEHDEGPMLTALWDAVVRIRGSIIQRRDPQDNHALSLYIPISIPEDYS